MSNPYSTQTISGYNQSPPADDGSNVSTNEIKWATHKTKLGDPVKTLAEAINTELLSAFGLVFGQEISTHSGNYTVVAGDQGKFLSVTGTTTITLLAAATAGANFALAIINNGSGVVTVDGNGAETINGNTTITLNPGNSIILTCNGALWAGAIGLGDQSVKTAGVASAVNEITVTNAATGNGPDISATGTDTNIDINLTPKGTGRVIAPHKGALVYLTANESISNATFTHISFDAEDYDTSSIHDNATNNQRLTVPTGVTKVKFYGQVIFLTDGTGIRRVTVSKNDETTNPTGAIGTPDITVTPNSGTRTTVQFSTPVISVTASDYFTVAVYQSSGGALEVDADYDSSKTYFAMEIIE